MRNRRAGWRVEVQGRDTQEAGMAQSKAQKETVGRVMHEFKHGELKRGTGGKVRNPKQAIAIALSEAGASNQQDEATNKRRLAETKRRERQGQTEEAETEGRRGRSAQRSGE